jgi:endoglucanase
MKIFFLTAFLLFSISTLESKGFDEPHEINRRLGRGINMGNTFEAPSETEWGNPWKPEYFKIMKVLGFSHVRIPIRWATAQRSMETAPYTIEPAFMHRVKEVIDNALKNQLHPVINMHHHEALLDDPEGQKDRFLAQWKQISTFFKDYPDSLVFEVLNEPHNNLNPEKWNLLFAEALAVIRETNPQRTVMIGTAEWGGLGGLSKLKLPNDQHLILTVHYYNPFQFTHQGASWSGEQAMQWLGTKWNDTEPERQKVIDEFAYAIRFSQEHKIPIHVGEFGAYSTADIESRVRWTRFLARWFDQQGFSWAYWEFSAGFGIYNPSTKELLTPLVDALLNSPMAEPTGMPIAP